MVVVVVVVAVVVVVVVVIVVVVVVVVVQLLLFFQLLKHATTSASSSCRVTMTLVSYIPPVSPSVPVSHCNTIHSTMHSAMCAVLSPSNLTAALHS